MEDKLEEVFFPLGSCLPKPRFGFIFEDEDLLVFWQVCLEIFYSFMIKHISQLFKYNKYGK